MDLSRWSREYYSPPLLTRLMLRLGAKPIRCAYCRVNFWSFRVVKERFDKHKRAARSQVVIPVGGSIQLDQEAGPGERDRDFQAMPSVSRVSGAR